MSTKQLQIKKKDTGYRAIQAQGIAESLAEDDSVRLNVEISKTKRQALKTKAALEGRTVQAIVNALLDAYLADETLIK